MKELIDFVTVSAVVAASIFFALLIEPLLLEGVLMVVDRGIRQNRTREHRSGHLVELQLNTIPVTSSVSEDRR